MQWDPCKRDPEWVKTFFFLRNHVLSMQCSSSMWPNGTLETYVILLTDVISINLTKNPPSLTIIQER